MRRTSACYSACRSDVGSDPPHLVAWRERLLGRYRYILLDAQYQKVRQGGQVLDAVTLLACGVDEEGHRDVLGCAVSLSEAEVHWRKFLASLKDRGLHGLELIVSDAYEGLKAARKAVFPSVPWQRCQFHLQPECWTVRDRTGLAGADRSGDPGASSIRRTWKLPSICRRSSSSDTKKRCRS